MKKPPIRTTRALLVTLLLLFTLFSVPAPMPTVQGSSTWTQASSADFLNGSFKSTVLGGVGGIMLNRTVNGTWARMTPSAYPAARAYGRAATIFGSDNIVTFGGWDGMVHLDDTWTYTLGNNTWTPLAPAERPLARDDFVMSPVHRTDKVVLFGGETYTYENDTWIFNATQGQWYRHYPANSPSARVKSSSATVYNDDKMVIFGGWDGTSILNDTWVYDVSDNQWSKRSPPVSPPARDTATLAAVPGYDKMVLYGGKSGSFIFNDTWVYSFGDDRWTEMFPPTNPGPNYGNTMVSFENRDEFMLFGGVNLGNALWVYDLRDNRWTQQYPVTSPYARHDYMMASVYGTDNAVLFGGFGGMSGSYLSSTWAFNLTHFSPSGAFTSAPRDMGGPANILTLRWNCTTPDGTSIGLQLRGADSLANLTSAPFLGPNGANASFYNLSGQPVWSGLNGSRWVQYQAVLSTMLLDSTPSLKNVTMYFDLLPGAPMLISPAEGAWVNSSAGYSWHFMDNDTPVQGGFRLQLCQNPDFSFTNYDSGEVASNDSSHFPSLGDGNYYWRVRTNDSEGAWGPYSVPRLVRIDTARPEIVLIAPGVGTLETTEFTMFGTATDIGSGLSRVEAQADGGDWMLANGTTNWRVELSLANGSHTVRVRALDRVNNSNQIEANYTINRAPTVRITSPPEGSRFNSSEYVNLTADGSDPDEDVLTYIWKDEATPVGTGSSLSLRFPEGNHTVSVTVSDGNGHEAGAQVNLSVYAVLPVPTVRINSPVEGTVLPNGSLAVNLTVTNFTIGAGPGLPHLHYRLSDGTETSWFSASTIILSGIRNGNHVIRVFLVDGSDRNLTNPEAFSAINFSVNDPVQELPDLSVWPADMNVSPAAPRAQDVIKVRLTVHNTGASPTSSFTVRLFVDGVAKSSQSISPLAPGANGTVFLRWTATQGNHTFRVMADSYNLVNERDETNNELSIQVVVGPAVARSSSNWLFPAMAAIVVAAVVSVGVLAYGRKRRGGAGAGTGEKEAGLRPLKEPFTIDDIFLIYGDGRLMQHTTRRLGHSESGSEIMASMLTAVQVFIKDALSKGEEAVLGSMEYSGRKILLEGDKYLILALVVNGPEPDGLRSEMVQTLRNIRSEYGTIIPRWDGDLRAVQGASKFLNALSDFRAEDVSAIEKKRNEKLPSTVKVFSEVEFYQGFARLKVAVKNDGDMMVADAALDLHFNDEILRLDRIEPAYQVSGKRVLVGNIGPKEKKSVAFYLDPQICTESAVDGVLTYRDAKGEFQTSPLKRRMVTVVCPILHTEENINTAMLKRTIAEELDQKDSKVFGIPASVTNAQAFSLGKRAVEGHDVRFVREFSQKEPYKAEAWYFGRTQGRDAKLVIRVTAREEGRTLEFFVASNSRLAITGLLAELRGDLIKHQKESAPSVPKMEQVFDGTVREKLESERPLLDKYLEGIEQSTN